MNSAAMDQQAGKYCQGLWGTRRSSSRSSTASPVPAAWPASSYASEPSWEEQAFVRDAAAHLGGCVWPPRSYTCTFCQREFRSAQALGGHMNVHRRDRALLRQGSSPEAAQDQPQQAGPLFLYRAASNPTSTTTTSTATTTAASSAAKGDVIITTPHTSYLSTIIKESSKNNLFMSMPADQAIDQCDHGDDGDKEESAGRAKRRRLDQPSLAPPVFVQPTAAATEVATCESQELIQGINLVDDAKVPQTKIPRRPSSDSPLVDQHQEVDLELRLGASPKVT